MLEIELVLGPECKIHTQFKREKDQLAASYFHNLSRPVCNITDSLRIIDFWSISSTIRAKFNIIMLNDETYKFIGYLNEKIREVSTPPNRLSSNHYRSFILTMPYAHHFLALPPPSRHHIVEVNNILQGDMISIYARNC